MLINVYLDVLVCLGVGGIKTDRLKGYRVMGLYKNSSGEKTLKGHSSTKKGGTLILVRDISSLPNTNSYKIA